MSLSNSGLASRPDPLIAITGEVIGEPDAIARLVKALQLCFIAADLDRNKVSNMTYKEFPKDFIFPLAKNEMLKSTRLSLEKEILKGSWMEKHCEERPSLVIMLCTFYVNWSDREWEDYEASVQTRHINLKTSLASRNTKLLLVAIKVGNEDASVDQEVLAHRKSSLTSTLQLDNYNFDMISIQDFDGRDNGGKSDMAIQMIFRKIFKYSMSYYAMQVKRALAKLEGCISDVMQTYANNAGDEDLTTFGDPTSPGGGKGVRIGDVTYLGLARARYNYKAAFFCDFQGLPNHSLGYYRKSFQSLISVAENVDEELRYQSRALLELSNYRICDYLVRMGNIGYDDHPFYRIDDANESSRALEIQNARVDAMTQFEVFITHFRALALSNDSVVDTGYVCRQYLLYLSLLFVSEANGKADSANVAHIANNNLSELYLCSAKLAIRAREGSFSNLLSMESPHSPSSDRALRPGDIFMREVGIGRESGEISALGLALDGESSDTDHHQLIVLLLQRAYNNTPERHFRRRAHILMLECDQFARIGRFEMALEKIEPMLIQLRFHRWAHLAVPSLRKKMAWAIFLGKLPEYLDAALCLYGYAMNEGRTRSRSASGGTPVVRRHSNSNPGGTINSAIGRHDLEELNRDILSVITSFGRNITEELVLANGKDGTQGSSGESLLASPFYEAKSAFVAIPWRPEYGMSATSDLEYVLPHRYKALCSTFPSSSLPRLFDISVEFDNITCHRMGSIVDVQVHIVSRFYGMLHVSQCTINWSLSPISQTFNNIEEYPLDTASSDATDEGADERAFTAPLDFAPGEQVTLRFPMPLTGPELKQLVATSEQMEGALLCVQSVDFVVKSVYNVDKNGNGLVGAPPGASPHNSPISSSSTSTSENADIQAMQEEEREFIFRVRTVPDNMAEELTHLQDLELAPGKQTHSFLANYAGTVAGRNLADSSNIRVMRVAKPMAAVQILEPPIMSHPFPASVKPPKPPSKKGKSSGDTSSRTPLPSMRHGSDPNPSTSIYTEPVVLHSHLVQHTVLLFDPCGEDLSECVARLSHDRNNAVPSLDIAKSSTKLSDVYVDSKEGIDRFLFWWPSGGSYRMNSKSGESNQKSTGYEEDIYHPLLLNSLGQPARQVSLQPVSSSPGSKTLYKLPLYLRSRPGSVVISVSLQLQSGTEKVFMIPLTFSMPLDVSFNMVHSGDVWPSVHLRRSDDKRHEVVALIGKGPIELSPRSTLGSPPSTPGSRSDSLNIASRSRALSNLKPVSALTSPMASSPSHASHKADEFAPVVVSGDTLPLSVELTCNDSLGEQIRILSFTLSRLQPSFSPTSAFNSTEEDRGFQSVASTDSLDMWVGDAIASDDTFIANTHGTDSGKSKTDVTAGVELQAPTKSFFAFVGENDGQVDLLKYELVQEQEQEQEQDSDHRDEKNGCFLRSGEVLAGVADIQCLPSNESSNAAHLDQEGVKKGQLRLSAQEICLGTACIKWSTGISTMDKSEDRSLPLWSRGTVDNADEGDDPFSAWAVDTTVTGSSTCCSYFEIPPVILVQAPFQVTVEEPTNCKVGEPAYLRVTVTSFLMTCESLTISLGQCLSDGSAPSAREVKSPSISQQQQNRATVNYKSPLALPQDFLIAGGACQTVTLAPLSRHNFCLSIIPLRSGHVLLPAVELIWKRYDSCLLSLSRHVYIGPAPANHSG